MSTTTLYRLAGLAAILAGIAYLSDTALDYLQPQNTLGVGIFVSLFGLYGLAGLFSFQREQGGYLNLVGYVLNSTGLAALIGVVFTNNFILPNLETAVIQELFAGPLLPIFITIGVIYLIGVLLFSAALWRANLFSKYAIGLYALGSIPAALPNVFPAIIVTIGGILVSIGIAWLGTQLWRGLEVQVQPVTA